MADVSVKASVRERSGKGVARRLRLEGKVPAVIYGGGKEPVAISLDGHDLLLNMQKGGFFTRIHELEFDGKKQKVLARDAQFHPINDKPLHVDFLRFDAKKELAMQIAVHIIDEDKCPGLEIGGVLQLVRPEVELICRGDAIPEYVEVSLEGLNIGESAKISEVKLPEGVRPSVDRDFTIASIVSTRTSTMTELDEEAEAEAAEAAEGGEEGAEEAPAEGGDAAEEGGDAAEEGGDEAKTE